MCICTLCAYDDVHPMSVLFLFNNLPCSQILQIVVRYVQFLAHYAMHARPNLVYEFVMCSGFHDADDDAVRCSFLCAMCTHKHTDIAGAMLCAVGVMVLLCCLRACCASLRKMTKSDVDGDGNDAGQTYELYY